MTTSLHPCAFALLLTAAPASADPLPDFAREIAGTIVAVSDGDFLGSTYATGALAPAAQASGDVLTVLSTEAGKPGASTIAVSNSVTSPPEILALSPDGATAYVVERLGERRADDAAIADLVPGNRLFAIDIADGTAPRVAATVEVGPSPEAVAVSPDGRTVAVVSNTPEASLVELVQVEAGGLGAPQAFDLAAFGVEGRGKGPRRGLLATNVQWHPSGRFLAVNLASEDRIAFFAVGGEDGAPSLQPWGPPVDVGKDPFVGRFTPDGGYYLTADWGRDFAAKSLDGRIPDAASSISVVRLADPASDDPRHERIGSAETDESSEGLAVSPDGRLVAAVNMRGTVFPAGTPRFDREATVTLLAFDPASGKLTKLGDTPFEGVLPEGGSFDRDGRHFLATVFAGHEGAGQETGSGLEVFRVGGGETPSLERLGRIPMPAGVHHVAIGPSPE